MPPKRKASSSAAPSKRPTRRRTSKKVAPKPASETSESSDKSSSVVSDLHLNEDNPGEDEDSHWEDEEAEEKTPKVKKKPSKSSTTTNRQSQVINVTLQNYNELDLDMDTIKQLMSATGRQTRNRIPSDIQKELKSLQFMYRRAKKLLALAAHCSEKTINEYLHEVSIRTKRTFYQSFLKYSIESANTTMPPRNTQEGFKERNQHLGHTWSNLEPDEKDIFNERMFFTLGYLACGWAIPPAEPNSTPLTDDEQQLYLPIFKRLVDMDKVARDLGHGQFGPHLPTARQNKGIQEITRIENELHTVHIRYGVDYALMASSWSPYTHNAKGLWEMQASSSDDWTTLTDTKWHLLENFVRHVAQSDLQVKPTRTKKPQACDLLKSQLTAALNQLVWQHLKPPLGRFDCHPKTSSPHITLQNRHFKDNIRLECIRDAASCMTDDLLSKPFEKMTTKTHQMWLNDINTGLYTVVKSVMQDQDQMNPQSPLQNVPEVEG